MEKLSKKEREKLKKREKKNEAERKRKREKVCFGYLNRQTNLIAILFKEKEEVQKRGLDGTPSRGRPFKHEATPHNSQGDATTDTLGGVLTHEQTQVVNGCGPESPPPTHILPSPQRESLSTTDVDMESGAIPPTNMHITPSTSARRSRRSQGNHSLNNSPDHTNQQRERHKRPHLGNRKIQLRRSHSREARERNAPVIQQMQDGRFLATVQILHHLSITCPRSRSTPLSSRSSRGSISGNSYQDMVHRLINYPNTILEIETRQSQTQHEDQHGESTATTIPTTNTPSNIPLPTHVEINGRRIPYPEGWGGMRNPNATLRSRTAVRWETIARLIVDPRA